MIVFVCLFVFTGMVFKIFLLLLFGLVWFVFHDIYFKKSWRRCNNFSMNVLLKWLVLPFFFFN